MQLRKRLFAGLLIAAAGAGGVFVLAGHGEDERVEKLMEKIHEGKRSPYRQLKRQAEADAPAWKDIEPLLARFDEMARALRESRNEDIKGSADGYVDAVTEIATATKGRDAKAFKLAVGSLADSCGDCHFKGGVGGELDD